MPSPRANLALAITAAAGLAVLPRPMLPLVWAFNTPATFLLAPVQAPVRTLMVWLRGPKQGTVSGGSGLSPELDRVLTDLDQAKFELAQSKVETERLRALVVDLSRGVELNPSLAVTQIPASVIGFGSDLTGGLLTVRPNKMEGVEPNAVVVVRGVQLVGRVQKVDARTCTVLPITDPAFPKTIKTLHGTGEKFTGVVMLDDQRRGPEWKLDSIENGRLVGRVYFKTLPPGEERPTITNDMLVRLSDTSWPDSSQMLTIGRVVQVETGPNERPIITVEPLQDISRVSEVMIRVPDKATTPAPASKGGKP